MTNRQIYVIMNDNNYFIATGKLGEFEETENPNYAKLFESEFEAEQLLKDMINIHDSYSEFFVMGYYSEDAFLSEFSEWDN